MGDNWTDFAFRLLTYVVYLVVIQIIIQLGLSEIEAYGSLIIYLLVCIWMEVRDRDETSGN